jgi:hypothetical protein
MAISVKKILPPNLKSHDHEPQQKIYIDALQSSNNLKIQSATKTITLSSLYNEEQTKLVQKHGVEELESN